MSVLSVVVYMLLGGSVLLAASIIGRNVLRQWTQRRLEQRAEDVEKLLMSAREESYAGLDKMLFDMRKSHGLEAIDMHLRAAIEEAGDEHHEQLASAFQLTGLAERYRDRVRSARGWRERAHAARILGALRDSEAVPVLLEGMRDAHEDTDVKVACAEALGQVRDPSVIPLLCTELANLDEWSSPRLAATLLAFGKPAVDPLLSTLDASESLNARVWAAQVLGKIGDRQATPALVDRLQDRHEPMRLSAANALADIGDARAVRPLIEVVLRDPSAAVRAQAASGLGRLGDSEAVAILVASLGDPEHWMRLRALEAIESLAPADVQPLETALSDASSEVRLRAALALERLGHLEESFSILTREPSREVELAKRRLIKVGRAGLSERFLRHLTADSAEFRRNIANILGKVGDASHAEPLVELLNDDETRVRLAAIEALGDLGAAATGPELVSRLGDEDAAIRDAATDALKRFPRDALRESNDPLFEILRQESDHARACATSVLSLISGEAVDEQLVKLLGDRFVEVRLRAVEAVGARGIDVAIDQLGTMMADSYGPVRVAASEALGNLGGERAMSLLIGRMSRADREQRDAICRGIATLGFLELGPALDVLLGTYDLNARLGAAWTLGKTADTRAVPLLAALLRDSQAEVRSAAAGALGKIASGDAVQHVAAALGDPSPFVRAACVNALGRIASDDQVKVLEGCFGDPDKFVRNRAAIAVGLIGGTTAAAALTRAVDKFPREFACIAFGLSGEPSAVGTAIALLGDDAISAKVSALLDRENSDVRQNFHARLRLSESGDSVRHGLDPQALTAEIEGALRHSHDAVKRRQAITALAYTKHEGRDDILRVALRSDPDPGVRQRAAEALGRDASSLIAQRALRDAIDDPAESVRSASLRAASEFTEPDQAAPFLAALVSRSVAISEAAIDATAHIYREDPRAFASWLVERTDRREASAGCKVLGLLRSDETLFALRAMSEFKNAHVRVQAVRALSELESIEAGDLLQRTLSDPSEEVRLEATRAVARGARGEALERLENLTLDPSPAVRRSLAEGLGESKNLRAVELLEKLTEDTKSEVSSTAIVGLLRITDPEGPRRFLSVWGETSDTVRNLVQNQVGPYAERFQEAVRAGLDAGERKASLEVLAALDARRFASDLAAALADPDPAIRLAAIEALKTLKPSEVADYLAPVVDDPVSAVREAARKALIRSVD